VARSGIFSRPASRWTAVGAASGQPNSSFQFSLWKDGLPMDAVPQQGFGWKFERADVWMLDFWYGRPGWRPNELFKGWRTRCLSPKTTPVQSMVLDRGSRIWIAASGNRPRPWRQTGRAPWSSITAKPPGDNLGYKPFQRGQWWRSTCRRPGESSASRSMGGGRQSVLETSLEGSELARPGRPIADKSCVSLLQGETPRDACYIASDDHACPRK